MPAALFLCVCVSVHIVCARERERLLHLGVAISSPKILTPDSFCHYRIVSSVNFLPSA